VSTHREKFQGQPLRPLFPEDVEELHRRAIYLLREGTSGREVAEILCVSQDTVYQWWRRYKLKKPRKAAHS
jgi:transposase